MSAILDANIKNIQNSYFWVGNPEYVNLKNGLKWPKFFNGICHWLRLDIPTKSWLSPNVVSHQLMSNNGLEQVGWNFCCIHI